MNRKPEYAFKVIMVPIRDGLSGLGSSNNAEDGADVDDNETE
jgi:hypothetical protein